MPWIGPVVGGGLGLLGSLFGPDEQTTTQQNMPSPFLTGVPGNGPHGFDPRYGGYNLLGSVNSLLGQSMDAGAGRVANMGREQQANDALFNRGRAGSPLQTQGSNYISNVLGGGGGFTNPFLGNNNPYLERMNTGVTGNTRGTATGIIGGQGLSPDSNPYLQQTFNRAADLTRGRLASEFAGSGRDLAASRPARSEELQTLASNIYGGNYQQERNRQASLTGQSLGLGQQNLGDQRSNFLQNLMNQRGTVQSNNALNLQQQMGVLGMGLPYANQDFTNINAMLQGATNPINTLLNRISTIAPAAGGTAVTSQPVYNDPFGAALGGAALGAQFGGLFGKPSGGGNPYGSFY